MRGRIQANLARIRRSCTSPGPQPHNAACARLYPVVMPPSQGAQLAVHNVTTVAWNKSLIQQAVTGLTNAKQPPA